LKKKFLLLFFILISGNNLLFATPNPDIALDDSTVLNLLQDIESKNKVKGSLNLNCLEEPVLEETIEAINNYTLIGDHPYLDKSKEYCDACDGLFSKNKLSQCYNEDFLCEDCEWHDNWSGE